MGKRDLSRRVCDEKSCLLGLTVQSVLAPLRDIDSRTFHGKAASWSGSLTPFGAPSDSEPDERIRRGNQRTSGRGSIQPNAGVNFVQSHQRQLDSMLIGLIGPSECVSYLPRDGTS